MPDEQKIKVFKALSDPIRLEIVRKLARGDCSQSFEALSDDTSLSQPSMSHHFSKLADAGILLERKDGRCKYGDLDRQLLRHAGIDIETLITEERNHSHENNHHFRQRTERFSKP